MLATSLLIAGLLGASGCQVPEPPPTAVVVEGPRAASLLYTHNVDGETEPCG